MISKINEIQCVFIYTKFFFFSTYLIPSGIRQSIMVLHNFPSFVALNHFRLFTIPVLPSNYMNSLGNLIAVYPCPACLQCLVDV